jgi:hypothetical protein
MAANVPTTADRTGHVLSEARATLRCMRELDDPLVQELALALARDCVIPWAQDMPSNGACAVLSVHRGSRQVAWAPDHHCPMPERLLLRAASLFLDYDENGADNGWGPFPSGNGHMTWLSPAGVFGHP